MKISRFPILGLFVLLAAPLLFSGELSTGRYALLLNDPSAVERFPSAAGVRGSSGSDQVKRILAAQSVVRQSLESRKYQVTGAVQILLNAVFVKATPDQVGDLRSIPGVRSVVPLKKLHMQLDRAVQLANVPAAWQKFGGTGNAGSGIKIAVIDTGIDQTHPGFQDSSLSMPAGFPKCTGDDCKFTTNKVIVARSYVASLAAGVPSDPASTSTPDDLSPRDRVGHGTALAMISAGVTNQGPADTITGVAPKAWLGNYKVYGSPEVNDGTFDDIIVMALDDAVRDGMDIAILSSGGPALSGPLDKGAICGNSGNDPCDIASTGVERASAAGLTVVIATGNLGDTGTQTVPTLNTIAAPATAPSAIAVGATSNSHAFYSRLSAAGQNYPVVFGDGPMPTGPLTAPLSDVAKLDGNGQGCTPLAAGSLTGTAAIVLRSPGVCSFLTKVNNVQNAGAVAAVVVDVSGPTSIFPGQPGGLTNTQIPTVLMRNTDGQALKNAVNGNSGLQVIIDPTLSPVDVSGANDVVVFSSRGPSIDYAIKPDLVSVGENMYIAAQRYDPNGIMYDPSGYIVEGGTSFSAPLVAGAVALVKQQNPKFTPAQLKSAVMNTAGQDVTDNGAPAGIYAAGAGRLDAGGAVQATITANPASISFGSLDSSTRLPMTRQFTLHYSGTGTASASLAIAGRNGSRNVPTLDKSSLSFTAAQPDQTVTLTLSGSLVAGVYEGGVTVQGAGTTLRIPYMFVVGDGVPADAIALYGDGFDAIFGQSMGGVVFKVIDQYGVAVPNLPVQWAARGGGSIRSADTKTDTYGMAFADGILGTRATNQSFLAQAGGITVTFSGTGRVQPTISSNGVVNAASFQAGAPVAPGSYISIFGTWLSDYVDQASYLPLPLALDGVTVSFDVPSAGISVPGRLIYVNDPQVNVQVPWELQGQTSVQMKVTVNGNFGNVVTVPLSDYAPAIFSGNGIAAALDQNNATISATTPAQRGKVVQIFANGLGPVDNQPASGEPASTSPFALSRTKQTPVVTIGNVNAQVQFSGLAPGFPGLYQVNVIVPANAPTGSQPVVISIGGQTSAPVNIPVQ